MALFNEQAMDGHFLEQGHRLARAAVETARIQEGTEVRRGQALLALCEIAGVDITSIMNPEN